MAFGSAQPRRLLLLAALFGMLALLIAAGPAAEDARAAGPCNEWGNKESNEITVGHARKAVLCLLNRERHARGLPKLDRDRKLQRASQKHNDYMQNHHCFSHQCSGEASLTTRLRNVGWLTGGLSAWSYGENIAWGSGHQGTPRNIVQAWMNSAGHRANILSRTFDEVGVGYTKGTITSKGANGSIMTTDFGWKVG
ncbi:MAG: CAP domain-containing protein [Actinomycetota bacterium]|nr:CAP domain-containing protein [Actinomycetota bacterium]